jgi:hypothetical protein
VTKPDDHGPIEAEFHAVMNGLAMAIDELFNGQAKGHDRKVSFVLLTAKFGEIDAGRVNYISNGNRIDIIQMMKEITARFEAQGKDEQEPDQ